MTDKQKPAFVIPPRPACIYQPPRPQPPQAADGAAPQGRQQPSASADGAALQGLPARVPEAGARKCSRPFNHFRSVTDEQSFAEPLPKGCKPALVPWLMRSAAFVPVSFAAKDWNVTSRRIRALLTAGRLAGRVQENGYWEVQFPYSFTFGTRGPSLKRQHRPEKPPSKPGTVVGINSKTTLQEVGKS